MRQRVFVCGLATVVLVAETLGSGSTAVSLASDCFTLRYTTARVSFADQNSEREFHDRAASRFERELYLVRQAFEPVVKELHTDGLLHSVAYRAGSSAMCNPTLRIDDEKKVGEGVHAHVMHLPGHEGLLCGGGVTLYSSRAVDSTADAVIESRMSAAVEALRQSADDRQWGLMTKKIESTVFTDVPLRRIVNWLNAQAAHTGWSFRIIDNPFASQRDAAETRCSLRVSADHSLYDICTQVCEKARLRSIILDHIVLLRAEEAGGCPREPLPAIVCELAGKGVPSEELAELSRVLREQLRVSGHYHILEPELAAEMIAEMGYSPACRDAETAKSIGRALGWRYVVCGRVAKEDKSYQASLYLIDCCGEEEARTAVRRWSLDHIGNP